MIGVSSKLKRKHASSSSSSSSAVDRLRDFGYEFVNEKLVQANDHSQAFVFTTQKEYVELCALVSDVVDEMMVELGLEMRPLGDSGESPLFVSAELEKASHVVVLMHGSNNRAGLWSRRVIINDALNEGSMLPYIAHCLAQGWGVVVPNHSIPFVAAGRKVDNALTYVEYLWDHVLQPLPCQKFAVVAHSFGGAATFHMLCAREQTDILRRIACIAFTDSVHNLTGARTHALAKAFLASASVKNWVKSTKPLDAPMATKSGTRCVSAGDNVHERCSHAAADSVLAFVAQQLARRHVPVRAKAAASDD